MNIHTCPPSPSCTCVHFLKLYPSQSSQPPVALPLLCECTSTQFPPRELEMQPSACLLHCHFSMILEQMPCMSLILATMASQRESSAPWGLGVAGASLAAAGGQWGGWVGRSIACWVSPGCVWGNHDGFCLFAMAAVPFRAWVSAPHHTVPRESFQKNRKAMQ